MDPHLANENFIFFLQCAGIWWLSGVVAFIYWNWRMGVLSIMTDIEDYSLMLVMSLVIGLIGGPINFIAGAVVMRSNT